MSEFNMTTADLMGIYSSCGTIGIVMSVFVILSAVLTFKRRLWGIALVGCFVGIATFLLTIFSGIIAVVPLILLIASRKEFN